jgi:hypothetical protein
MALKMVEVVANVMEDNMGGREQDMNCAQLITIVHELLSRRLESTTSIVSPFLVGPRQHPILGSQTQQLQRACNYLVLTAEKQLLVAHGSGESKTRVMELMHRALASWLQRTVD